MKKQVSVKDIAKELNISLSTVHKAMTGKGGISEERRKEVLKTAEKMGYTVNSVAQTLARKDINIGIMMPSGWQEYFEEMKRGMEKEIENLKKFKVTGFFYFLSSDFTKENSEKAFSWLKEKHIDAVIYCPSLYSLHEEFAEGMKKSGIPVFLAGGSSEDIESVSEIVTDSALSGKIAADFLRCICPGGVKAAVLTGSLSVKSHKEKVDAFIKRVKDFGGMAYLLAETEDNEDETYKIMKGIGELDVNSVYVTTATSIPVCKALSEQGLCEKIALICTDIPKGIAGYMEKNVVKGTIYQNQEKVGAAAVRSAYEYLVKKSSYGNENVEAEKCIYIKPELYMLSNIE